ncbi:MAG TPA: transglutaminaseTgpA domain-containing protein [Symbiobacteriaceae bacterium]|nr:transglutaminaseTgpA domain-containing protein [Symbiobacteriaceae bacterium]
MVAERPSVGYQSVIALLTALMLNSLLASLSAFWKLSIPQNTLLYLAIAGAALGWLLWRFPWATTLLVLGGTAAVLFAMSRGYLPQALTWLQLVTRQSAEFVQSWQEYQLEASFGGALGSAFLALTAMLGGLVILSEALSRGNTFWSIAAGTIVFGTEWAWYYDDASSYFIVFTVLAFLIWILAQAARRDAHWISTGRKVGYRTHVVTPLAWVLVVALLAMFLPSSFEPLDLGSLGEKAQEAFPVLKRLRGAGVGVGGGRFSLRVTGFNPTMGALGGPVKLDHSLALQITPDVPLKETAYLRGATFQVYDGRTWTASKLTEVEIPSDGTLPTYFGSDVLRDYTTVTVKHAVSMGYTLFNLWEPLKVEGVKSGYRADVDSNTWSTRQLGKDAVYQVQARWPRYSGQHIASIEPTAPDDTYKPYLQLPENLPDRVRALTRGLTQGQEHPYNKAVAIERYLRSLPYELNVPAPPTNRDFVDYFLFDLKEGYCVYSASAMTVMLRELGIPSRLVEGFAVPAGAQYTEDASGKRTYSVLNSQAHAWVEAYFGGYGWVTFDPTPRSDVPLIDRTAPAPAAPDTTGETEGTGEQSENDVPDPNLRETPEDGNIPVDEGGLGGGTASSQLPWGLGALALVGVLVFLLYQRLRSQDRIVARESREAVQEIWFKAGALLRLFDAGPSPSQTAKEYAVTLGNRWPALKEPAAEMAQEYTEARYSPPGHPVPEGAQQQARTFWEKVHEVLFSRYGWRAYLWRRLKWRKDKAE